MGEPVTRFRQILTLRESGGRAPAAAPRNCRPCRPVRPGPDRRASAEGESEAGNQIVVDPVDTPADAPGGQAQPAVEGLVEQRLDLRQPPVVIGAHQPVVVAAKLLALHAGKAEYPADTVTPVSRQLTAHVEAAAAEDIQRVSAERQHHQRHGLRGAIGFVPAEPGA